MTLQPTDQLTILQTHVRIGDPHTASDNNERLNLQTALLEALVRLEEEGDYAPLLAKAWHVEADGCTWIFQLRPHVLFHNGELLDAQDVVACVARACDPSLGGELGTDGLYYNYLHAMAVTALDNLTVQMVTATPIADLLDLLVEIPILPRGTLPAMPQTLIGSGPYRLVEANNDSVVMAAFDEYWGGKPPVRTLHWRAEPDAQRRADALRTGQADLITKVPLSQRQLIAADPNLTLHVAQGSVCVAFLCNAQTGVCTERRVRQALNYALDVDAIMAELMAGTAELLNGPLTSLHLGHDPATPRYPYDPLQAKALLAAAGYGEGMTLVLDVPTTLPDEAVRLAELMAGYYAAVGVRTEIKRFTDRPAYANMVKNKGIHDACCFDSSPLSTFRPLREKFHSGIRGPWWQGYANPAVDGLLDQAQRTMDIPARQQIYRQAYRIIRDDAAWIFLYSPTLAWGAGPRLAGLCPTRDGLIRFW